MIPIRTQSVHKRQRLDEFSPSRPNAVLDEEALSLLSARSFLGSLSLCRLPLLFLRSHASSLCGTAP
jgi:hypothetical protein